MNLPDIQLQSQFAACLLDWYDQNRRILPWREDPAPYHIWLSEIMLQQTRVEAVKSYYARFLDALPDIAALAAAPEDLWLKLWEGLGYYSRVRNLHKGAVYIMEECKGEMPHTSAELLKVPGIGPYTAAAIASIAFGERIPAVDGNLLRVYARLTGYAEDIKSDTAKKAAAAFYLRHMCAAEAGNHHFRDYDRPGDFNQALMDLGATVCLPNAAPHCGRCPLQEFCEAHKAGEETLYPVAQAKKERKIEQKTVFLIHDADRIALRKRPLRGLLAGLYEYPNTDGHLDEKAALRYLKSIGFAPLRIVPLGDARHIFTHKEWHMTGYEVLSDELAGFGEISGMTDAEKPPETEKGHISGQIFLAEIPEIRDQYSIPSAFAVYTDRILPNRKTGA